MPVQRDALPRLRAVALPVPYALALALGLYRAARARDWGWLAAMVLLLPIRWMLAWVYLGSRKSPNAVGRLTT